MDRDVISRQVLRERGEVVVVDGRGNSSWSPKRITTCSSSMSVSSVHFPMAIATRPQFGSAPCTAVFTRGELTIALATRLA